MSFNFKRALRRATYMAMMDEERNKEPDPLAITPMDWLDAEGLDYDELNEMSEKKRNKILEKHGLDPDDYDFD